MDSQVLTGDCYGRLKNLPSKFQLVFVDPPYNIGIDYGPGKQADLLKPDVYLEKLERLAALCVNLLTPTGSIWFLVPERCADSVGIMLSQLLPRRNRIIWRERFGQYREDRFASGHRHIFWHVKDPKQTPFFTDDIRIPSQRMLSNDLRAKGHRVPDDVWEFPRLVGNSKERCADHPCQLPEAILERIVRCSTQPGDFVLDPMAGTGTTLRVAQRLERHFVGIEEQPHFVELIEKRLAKPYQKELL